MKLLTVGQFLLGSKRVQDRRKSAQPLNRNPVDEVLIIVCVTGLAIVITRFLGII